MGNSADWSPRAGRPDWTAYQIYCARYDAAASTYEYLPNVACDAIQYREGAEPPAARFRYVMDDRYAESGWPTQFQTIMRLSQSAAAGDVRPEEAARYVVEPGERIVVLGFAEGDEIPWVLFDGFARSPQADVTPSSQGVGFDAVGVSVRFWDNPIAALILRDAFEADEIDKEHNRLAELRVVFNPDHRAAGLSIATGNCTADGYDHEYDPEDDEADPVVFPVFVDPTFVREFDDPLRPTFWTLEKLARYLMGGYNAFGKFVANPDFDMIKSLLDNRRPKEGQDTYNPADDSTYETSPIVIPELDATGRVWVEVLNEHLIHYGFAMALRCEDDGMGFPSNFLELYRKDGSGPYGPKKVPFQKAREFLDTNQTSVSTLGLSRDFGAAFNGVIIETALTQWEIAVILAPGFQIESTDASAGNAVRFRKSNLLATPEDRDKYRLWVCDEFGGKIAGRSGDGYLIGSMEDATPLDCFKIWFRDGVDAKIKETRRRRPGRNTILSRDADGKPRQASLSLSIDYEGPVNALWDGTGEWQEVPIGGGWAMLRDRLGIMIDGENPEEWKISQKTGAGVIIGNPVKLVTRCSAPNDQNPPLFMRLTTVIEGDQRARKAMPRRASSLMKETRYRHVDARSSFRNEMVHESSPNYAKTETIGPTTEDGPKAKYVRDDRDKVKAYATQIQQSLENPPVSGSISIPWITRAYIVGDQISEIKGRDLSLQTNGQKDQGEAPKYPYVVGVDWNFSGGQSTTLHLSDRIVTPYREG